MLDITAPVRSSPIPMQGRTYDEETIAVVQICLKCHGDTTVMSDQVRKAITASYLDDKAFGYKEGDFRGIISVIVRKCYQATIRLWRR
jgi:hypothetical protein